MSEDTELPICSLEILDNIRVVLDQIANKWSIMVLTLLYNGPVRFNTIKRHLGNITHKSLTDTLRRLERSGLITRQVICSSPVAVQYQITELGKTLETPVVAMLQWTEKYAGQVIEIQQRNDSSACLDS